MVSGAKIDGDVLCTWKQKNVGFPANWDCSNGTGKVEPCLGIYSDWTGISCDIGTGRVTSVTLEGYTISGLGIGPEVKDLQVTTLNLGNNSMNGTIPNEIGLIKNLSVLYLDRNKIFGTIPASLWSLPKIKIVDLAFNNLTGGIANIGNLSSGGVDPDTVFLNNNQLSGSIPSNISGLTGISVLDLSYNKFSGSIPAELANIVPPTLNLRNNNLTGFIPAQFSYAISFLSINLANNGLWGCFPNTSTWKSLTSCDVSGNPGMYCDSICKYPRTTSNAVCTSSTCATIINQCNDGNNRCAGYPCTFNGNNSYSCTCPATGYWGVTGCNLCTCVNGTCNNGPTGNGQCKNCTKGFYGADCERPCGCSNNATCVDGINGNGACTCAPGFWGTTCDFRCGCVYGICRDGANGNGECYNCTDPTVYGPKCNQPCTCDGGVCSNGVDGTGTCVSCKPGYYGPNCLSCNTSCPNGLSCMDTVTGSGECTSCKPGFFGPTCTQCAAICNPNGGTCQDGFNGSGYCANCTSNGYYGPRCLLCLCQPGFGICSSGVNGTGKCSSCNPAYRGPLCDELIPAPPAQNTTNITYIPQPDWFSDSSVIAGFPNFGWLIIGVVAFVGIIVGAICVHHCCCSKKDNIV